MTPRPSPGSPSGQHLPGDLDVATDLPSFAILGPLEVSAADGRRLAVGGRKQRELLSLLILHRNRAVSHPGWRPSCGAMNRPEAAEVTLRSHVSHLRRRLADLGSGDALTTGPAGYSLDARAGTGGRRPVRAARSVSGRRRSDSAGRSGRSRTSGRPSGSGADGPSPISTGSIAAAAEAARLEEVRLGALEVLTGGGAGLRSAPGDRRRTGGADDRAPVPGTLLRRSSWWPCTGPAGRPTPSRRTRTLGSVWPTSSGSTRARSCRPSPRACSGRIRCCWASAEVPPPPDPATPAVCGPAAPPARRRLAGGGPDRPGGPHRGAGATRRRWEPVVAGDRRLRAAVRRGRHRQDPPRRRAGAPGGPWRAPRPGRSLRAAGPPYHPIGAALRDQRRGRSRRSPTRPRPCWPRSGRCSNEIGRRRRRPQTGAARRRRTSRCIPRSPSSLGRLARGRTGAPDHRQRRAHRPSQRRSCCATSSNGSRRAC